MTRACYEGPSVEHHSMSSRCLSPGFVIWIARKLICELRTFPPSKQRGSTHVSHGESRSMIFSLNQCGGKTGSSQSLVSGWSH